MILVIVALILIAMSMVMPWYSLKVKASMSGVSSEMEMNWYLDRSEMTALGETQTSSYVDVEGDSEALNVFKTTQLFVYLGLVGCILGLVGAILVMTEKMSNKIGAVFVCIALILVLLAPFYLMFMFPGAVKNDLDDAGGASDVLPSGMSESFFGSQEQSISGVSTEYSWGGGIGWIFALIAFFLILIALIMVGRSSPAPLPMAPTQPAPQQAYQPAYQPPQSQQPPAQQPYTPQQPPPSQPPSPPPQEPSYPPPPPPP
jgi:hypothetical protein